MQEEKGFAMSVPQQSTDTPAHRYTAAFANMIEPRWQERWAKENVYTIPNPGEPGFDASRPKFYCLDMFPYPSGAGLHVGHPEGYTATDILCRCKRMQGQNVLHPMGWDAFGLPAEQYAIQTGVHPAITTRMAIDNFRRQLQRFGFSYDWSREVGTIDEAYYKWTQWIFVELYNAWWDGGGGERANERASERANEGGGRARRISELEAEFAAGTRVVRWNPKAEELPLAERARDQGGWGELDAESKRRVLDSYRLAYRAQTMVNWCPKLGTVLANDEVVDGRSERGGYPVLRKPMKQWMFRITACAERLLTQLDTLDWPESTKAMQREWIGRSEGAEIDFEVLAGTHARPLRVFTTRPDTIFGATYMVVAPEHELIAGALAAPDSAIVPATKQALREYATAARNRSEVDRQESKEKTGVFTGMYATNPATSKPIPIWTADYVLMGYGTGAIMAVPAHDERDFEFAKKFGLDVVEVVKAGANERTSERASEGGEGKQACFAGEGVACNSANEFVSLDGLATHEAKQKIIDWLEAQHLGTRRVNYKLRDWTFSRQRYWGEPFPIVYDAAGNHYPVSAKALPVKLPELADYAPIESDDPQPLLAKAGAWVRTTAGEAGVDPAILPPATPVTRETNTMPGSAGSSWYFLRYCDSRNANAPASRDALAYWMGERGVDLYLGGSEHAVGHLLYSRFWNNALADLGHVPTREPFHKLFHQGLITSFAYQRSDKTLVPVDQVEERDGVHVENATGQKVTQIVAKMSKSLKNVVNPDDVIAEFGADTFRLYEMAMGPLEASKPWNPRDIAGCFRFLQRSWRLMIDEQTGATRLAPTSDEKLERQLHHTIKKVGDDIEKLACNTAIAAMIEFVNAATSSAGGGGTHETPALSRDQAERFLLILSPFAPHLAEEVWHRLGHTDSIVRAAWPAFDPAMLIASEVEVPVSVNGKVKVRILVPASSAADAKSLEAFAMAQESVRALLGDKPAKKVIAVPNKMVNFVI
jgi:leucyl-tRNA synthetase